MDDIEVSDTTIAVVGRIGSETDLEEELEEDEEAFFRHHAESCYEDLSYLAQADGHYFNGTGDWLEKGQRDAVFLMGRKHIPDLLSVPFGEAFTPSPDQGSYVMGRFSMSKDGWPSNASGEPRPFIHLDARLTFAQKPAAFKMWLVGLYYDQYDDMFKAEILGHSPWDGGRWLLEPKEGLYVAPLTRYFGGPKMSPGLSIQGWPDKSKEMNHSVNFRGNITEMQITLMVISPPYLALDLIPGNSSGEYEEGEFFSAPFRMTDHRTANNFENELALTGNLGGVPSHQVYRGEWTHDQRERTRTAIDEFSGSDIEDDAARMSDWISGSIHFGPSFEPGALFEEWNMNIEDLEDALNLNNTRSCPLYPGVVRHVVEMAQSTTWINTWSWNANPNKVWRSMRSWLQLHSRRFSPDSHWSLGK
jgi:hypothetical protein